MFLCGILRHGEYLFLGATVGSGIIYLLSPTGYVFVAGDSMEPAIPAGCTVAATQSWDGNSSLESEVVTYRSNHTDRGIGGRSDSVEMVRLKPWLAHRVVTEYESYDSDEASHYYGPDGFLVIEDRSEIVLKATDHTYEEAATLEDERVLVLKGDNNEVSTAHSFARTMSRTYSTRPRHCNFRTTMPGPVR